MTVSADEVIANLDRLEQLLSGGISDQPIDTATYGDVLALENRVTAYVTANTVPTGGNFIGMFNAACPTGWTTVTAFDDKFLVGKATYGGTGGAAAHNSHSMSGVIAHSHSEGSLSVGSTGSHGHNYFSPGSNQSSVFVSGGATAVTGSTSSTMDGSPTHSHTGSIGGTIDNASVGGSVGTGSNLPPYLTVVWCSKN